MPTDVCSVDACIADAPVLEDLLMAACKTEILIFLLLHVAPAGGSAMAVGRGRTEAMGAEFGYQVRSGARFWQACRDDVPHIAPWTNQHLNPQRYHSQNQPTLVYHPHLVALHPVGNPRNPGLQTSSDGSPLGRSHHSPP